MAPVTQKLRAIEGQLTRLTGSHPLELGPKGLSNKLAALSRDVGRGDAKPTKQMYAVFEDLSARVGVQLRELDETIAKDIPAAMNASAATPGSRLQ